LHTQKSFENHAIITPPFGDRSDTQTCKIVNGYQVEKKGFHQAKKKHGGEYAMS
jgi:hypothetical protein